MVKWLITSIEEEGRLSGRKATTFIFVVLTVYTIYRHLKYGVHVDVNIWYGQLAMILLLLSIITVKDIILFKNGGTDNSK